MSDHPHVVSTGRGGQGNIGRDTTTYTDGTIIREGVAGESVDGEYSSGRGGAGNMVNSPRTQPERRGSQDVIPDANLISAEGHENYHTGRGGGGNVHKDKYGGHSHDPNKESILDKAKHKVDELLHKKPKEGSPAPPAV